MAIHITKLDFSYRHQSIYNSLNADINEAGIYGLFGRNGSGKSTLLKLIAGLLTPQSGTIDVLGYTPRQRLPDFLAHVYILPEEFHLPDLTPKALARSHQHFYPNFSQTLYHTYIDKLEVPSDKRFSQMSLGQKKKSAIAFALATLTPILLMDEPTNGLDIVSREQFKQLMQTPEQSQRITLISTHQAHDLERIIRHIWFIDDGQLLLSASMRTLSKKLAMGIAESSLTLPEGLLYQEEIGEQIAWIAKNTNPNSEKPLNIEMLSKALSLNKSTLIAAVQTESTPSAIASGDSNNDSE